MLTIITRMRILLVGLVLALGAPCVLANAAPAGTGATHAESPVDKQPAGSPEMGVLIIIGVVGFLILLAWIISRVSDEGRPSGDSTLI